MPTAAKIPAQSLENAVSTNDLNYILLKRKDGDQNEIPALHPRDSFTIFAMLDKFLGGDGLLAERLQFWTEDGAQSIIDDQKFDEILAATPSIWEYTGGKSLHVAPVLNIHNTAFINKRLFLEIPLQEPLLQEGAVPINSILRPICCDACVITSFLLRFIHIRSILSLHIS
jgi:hypothetical protein